MHAKLRGISIGAVSLVSAFVLTNALLWAAQNAIVEGRVYSSGNPVPGATVRLLDAFTAFSQVQTTNSDGLFVFNNVPATNDDAGEYYEISVEVRGYQRWTSKIAVAVGEEKLVLPPVALTLVPPPPVQPPAPQQPPAVQPETLPPAPVQPAAPPVAPSAPEEKPPAAQVPPEQPQPQPSVPSETRMRMPPVTVTVVAPSITPDFSTTVSGVIDSRAVHTLPLADRDFLDLALLAPGTYPVQQGSVLEGASLVVNGTRPDMNNFLLDGTDNNDYTINQSLPFQIVEAVQEFRVQDSTSASDFGRSGGAQINIISRRGVNQVHGSLFEFLRNSALDAGNRFSVYSGSGFDNYRLAMEQFGPEDFNGNPVPDPLSDTALANTFNNYKTPPLVQNQFGANLGGPLKKDKLFGFFNWESFRVSDPRPVFERVPGNELRQQTPCQNFIDGLDTAQGFGPGPGNTFTCDPAAMALYNLYPAPNVNTSAVYPDLFDFFYGQSANNTSTDNFLGRIDWRVGDRDNMSFKYNIQDIGEVQGGTVPQTSNYPGNGTDVSGRNQNLSYSYVRQFTHRASNDLRLGWNRFHLAALAQDRNVDPTTLGLQNSDFTNQGLPTITIGGDYIYSSQPNLSYTDPSTGFIYNLLQVGPGAQLGGNLSVPSTRTNQVWEAADTFSYDRGQHAWKFGGEYRFDRLYVLNEGLGRGSIAFYSPDLVVTNSSDDFNNLGALPDLASIGQVCATERRIPASQALTSGCSTFGTGFDRTFSTNSLDWFAQDQWRPRSNFTLNYGIRYEVNTAPVESRNRLVNYYPNILGPGMSGLMRGGDTNVFDPFGNVLGTAARAPRAGFNTDMNNWGPRVGFAWDPRKNGKTVIRGGYALMYDQEALQASVNMLQNPPFVMQDFSIYGFFTLDQTFQFASPSNGWFTLPYSITARDPNTRTPYVQQFHFGIQQQLGNKSVFEVAYVGSAGRRLPRLRDISPCPQNILAEGTYDPVGACYDKLDLTAPSENNFLFNSIFNEENSANSIYHSLQARLQTRNFHGLQMSVSYAFAKSLDDASSLQPPVSVADPNLADVYSSPLGYDISPAEFDLANNVSPALSLRPGLPTITTRPYLPQDSNNLRLERAPSDFDIRHRFVGNFIYSVPRISGLRGLGSGWSLAGIATLESGQPYTVFDDYFGNPVRPTQTSPITSSAGFPAAPQASNFTVPFNSTTGFFSGGTLGRNTFYGPKMRNLDFSILKDTRLGSERRTLQLRAEFFNLTNAVNYYNPYSRGGLLFDTPPNTFYSGESPALALLPDPFFGHYLQARSAFAAQFGLKLNF